MKKEYIKISKFISLVLRHRPQVAGLVLDPNGWVSVDALIEGANKKGFNLDYEILNDIVATNDKKRFAFDESRSHIRANQGHSVEIELQLTEIMPPDILYHGTAEKYWQSISKTGLIKKRRNHVHLSSDVETAKKVGMRHGKVIVLCINAHEMYTDNYTFYLSQNKVWLTESVPVKYIKMMDAIPI